MPEAEKRTPADPSVLVTSTGEHPAIVIAQPTRTMLVFGMALDLVALVGIFVLMALDKLQPSEGLPVIFLLLGVKVAAIVKGAPPSISALLSILGILRGLR
jgi:hypothetical protein